MAVGIDIRSDDLEKLYEEYKNINHDKESLKDFFKNICDKYWNAGFALAESFNDEKTLRDEFAIAALTGIISGTLTSNENLHIPATAEYAYEIADALLKERNKEIK